MDLETGRLLIREFRMEDGADLQEILGDSLTMEFMEPAYDFARTEAFLREFCIGRHGALAAVRKDGGKVIGYVLFNTLEDGLCEMGWVFHRDFWRQGYACEACGALIRYGFLEKGFHKIFAETIDGVRSVGLMKKLGMKREGIQRGQVRDSRGRWADLHLYGLLREDYLKKK